MLSVHSNCHSSSLGQWPLTKRRDKMQRETKQSLERGLEEAESRPQYGSGGSLAGSIPIPTSPRSTPWRWGCCLGKASTLTESKARPPLDFAERSKTHAGSQEPRQAARPENVGPHRPCAVPGLKWAQRACRLVGAQEWEAKRVTGRCGREKAHMHPRLGKAGTQGNRLPKPPLLSPWPFPNP